MKHHKQSTTITGPRRALSELHLRPLDGFLWDGFFGWFFDAILDRLSKAISQQVPKNEPGQKSAQRLARLTSPR
jgi:hypothetical protein